MSLPDELMRPGLELRQTHISWVFLSRSEVWKVKKPVSLGFLDFSRLEKRRSACESELSLNRRLAPSVYLGVVPVRRNDAGRLQFGGEGELVDWAVHMKRLPDEDRADVRLAAGSLEDEHIEAIAIRLARFHDECESNEKIARFGTVEVISGNVHENFEQARATILDYVSPDQAGEIESWQKRFLRERVPSFEGRVRAGRIRDGHGDLRLEHVYLDATGSVVVIDCIEFNERFRYAERTYTELLRRARCVLMTGRPVIVDASFRARRHRADVWALAHEVGVPVCLVECRPDAEVCRERLRHRQGGVSDGRLEIFDDFMKRWEPTTELPASEHIAIDTAIPLDQTMEVLRERLPLSFAGLTQ